MFDSALRTLKDRLLGPAAAAAVAMRLTPGRITALSLAAGLAAAGFAAGGLWPAALAFWILNRLLDGLDGAVARRTGSASDLGGYLDIMSDFATYAAVPLGIAAGAANQSAVSLWPAVAVLLAACYLNAASWMYLAGILEKRRAAAAAETSVAMPRGIIEGAETILFYTLALLLPQYAGWVFNVFTALVLVTVLQRIRAVSARRFF